MASGSSLSSFTGARPKEPKLNKKNPVPLPKLPNDKNKFPGSIRIVGYLRKDCVYINNVKSIDFLYEKGFFGKVPPPEFDPLIPKKDRPQKKVEKVVEKVVEDKSYLLEGYMRKMAELKFHFTSSDSTPRSSRVPTPENDPLPTQRERRIGKDLEDEEYLLSGRSLHKMDIKGCPSTSSDSTPRSSQVPTPEKDPLLTQRERQIGKDLEDEEYPKLGHSLHKIKQDRKFEVDFSKDMAQPLAGFWFDEKENTVKFVYKIDAERVLHSISFGHHMPVKAARRSDQGMPRSSQLPTPENDPLPTQIDKDFKDHTFEKDFSDYEDQSVEGHWFDKDFKDHTFEKDFSDYEDQSVEGHWFDKDFNMPRSSQLPTPENDPLPTQIDKDFKDHTFEKDFSDYEDQSVEGHWFDKDFNMDHRDHRFEKDFSDYEDQSVEGHWFDKDFKDRRLEKDFSDFEDQSVEGLWFDKDFKKRWPFTSSDSTPRSSQVPTPENDPLLTQRERQIGKDLEDEEYLKLYHSIHKMDIKGCPSTSSDSMPRSSQVPTPEKDPLPTQRERQIGKDLEKKNYLWEGWRRKMEQVRFSSSSSDSTPSSSQVPSPENDPLLTQRERQIGKDLDDEEYLKLCHSLHKMNIGDPFSFSSIRKRSDKSSAPIDLLSGHKLSDPKFDNEDRASDVPESDSTSNVTGSDSTSNVAGSDSTSNVARSDSTSNVAGSDSTSNVAGSDSKSNVTGSDSTSNVTSSDSTSNVTGSDSTSNVTGSDSTSNVAGSDSTSNVAGSDSTSNVAGSDSTSNVAGSDSTSNVAGSDSTSNVAGSDSTSNVAGSDSTSNVPGSDSTSNVPGSDSTSNVPGSDSTSNVPGSDSTSNVPGSDSTSNVPGSDSTSNVPGSDSTSYIMGSYLGSNVAESDLSSTEPEEELEITFEEAFFLSFGLECLDVKYNGKSMTLFQMWKKYSELAVDRTFSVSYAAFHHFRSKNWLVKCDHKVDTDYVLYRSGPPYRNPPYAVIVMDGEMGKEVRKERVLTWYHIAELYREYKRRGMRLLFCYVIKEASVKKKTPTFISSFRMKEVLVKDWFGAKAYKPYKPKKAKKAKKNP